MRFEEYVAARGPSLLRLAFLLSGDAHAAQDLSQIALGKAFVKWRQVASLDRPDAYVRRILLNAFLDTKRSRRDTAVDPADPALVARTVPDHAETVTERSAMWRALAGLPTQQRAVLVLRYYEGYDDIAIAEVLGCASSTVRSNATRGLAALRTRNATDGTPAPGAESPLRER